MARFWVSWNQPTEDYRPLNFPPNQKVLGYWCSGFSADDSATLCALVDAEHESDAMAAIQADWPEAAAHLWRFIEPRTADWLPGDRFPLSDWMRERHLSWSAVCDTEDILR